MLFSVEIVCVVNKDKLLRKTKKVEEEEFGSADLDRKVP
jgi:hypothetical protein